MARGREGGAARAGEGRKRARQREADEDGPAFFCRVLLFLSCARGQWPTTRANGCTGPLTGERYRATRRVKGCEGLRRRARAHGGINKGDEASRCRFSTPAPPGECATQRDEAAGSCCLGGSLTLTTHVHARFSARRPSVGRG